MIWLAQMRPNRRDNTAIFPVDYALRSIHDVNVRWRMERLRVRTVRHGERRQHGDH